MTTKPLAELRANYVIEQTGRLDYECLIKDVIGEIKFIDPELDLSRLKRISMGPSYANLLEELSKELGRPIKATERESSSGVGMLVPDTDGDILVVGFGLLEGLFHENGML